MGRGGRCVFVTLLLCVAAQSPVQPYALIKFSYFNLQDKGIINPASFDVDCSNPLAT